MGHIKILDTGVLIGIIVEQDQHHQDCIDYVDDSDSDAYTTPVVRDEFQKKIRDIQRKLTQQILKHRRNVLKHTQEGQLDRTDLVKIKENVLNTDSEAHRFLYDFYDVVADRVIERGPIERRELANKLSNMSTEVGCDGAREYGGFDSLVSCLEIAVDSYPTVESQLLICEGDDPDVCIEAHHVAETVSEDTELGTTNPRHFTRKHDNEPESRKENILHATSLVGIEDLSMSKYP